MSFKKTNIEFILTDSALNTYGFRLETSGYRMDEFLKNPIGYYGHDKEDGVLLRWEDLRTDGDRVIGRPVINLDHPRGARTLSEIEDGFLNAASLGGIVVLRHHLEPAEAAETPDVLVIDEWYNKECSLVDNPANRDAFATGHAGLMDANEREIALQDLMDTPRATPIKKAKTVRQRWREAAQLLDLADDAGEDAVLEGVRTLQASYSALQQTNSRLAAQLETALGAADAQAVQQALDKGLADGRINKATRDMLESSYAGQPRALEELLQQLPPYQSIADRLTKVPQTVQDLADKTYDELDRADRLHDLRSHAPDLYREKYRAKFGRDPR